MYKYGWVFSPVNKPEHLKIKLNDQWLPRFSAKNNEILTEGS